MTHAAGIIGHILVHDWIGARQPACAGGRHNAPPAQPTGRGLCVERPFRAAYRGLPWPAYVASVRQMSAGLSRYAAFRRLR